MIILRVNVAISVPSRYSFVKKACVTLTSSDSIYCYVPCGPISALSISRLLFTIDCSTAMSQDLGD